MNQVATQNQNVSTNTVAIASERGAKIAPQNLAEVVRFAEVMCRADIALPKHLRNNAGACMAVALQAMEWDMSPFAVASKSYAVNGQIAYEAQLIAAVVNTRSGIQGRLKYSFDGAGENLTCTVTGKIDGEEYSYTSPPVGAITIKNSPLWKTDPQQQLGYYSARSWARRYTPEVILGVYDREEAASFQGPDNARDVTPRQTVAERMAAARQAQAEDESQDTQEGFSLSYVHETTATAVDQQAEDIPADDEAQNEETPADDAPLQQEETQQAGDDRNVLAEVADELDRCETPDEVNDVVGKFQEQLNALPENDKATARLKVKEAKARVKGGEA